MFADPGWESVRLQTAVVQFILEHAYNLPSRTVRDGSLALHQALVSNKIDVNMEVWAENIPPYAADKAAGNVQEIGVSFSDNQSGFYVPRYVIEGDPQRNIPPKAPLLQSVQDLKNYSHVFSHADNPLKGRIYGTAQEWPAGTVLYNKFIYYRLDLEYDYVQPVNGDELARVFTDAYEKGQAIVAYYWTPTSLVEAYDLVLLQDAPYKDIKLYKIGATEFPSMRVVIAASNEFVEEYPEIVQFLNKYHTSSAALSQAMKYMHTSNASVSETARWFLRANDENLGHWLPPYKVALVRKALAETKGDGKAMERGRR